MKRIPALFVAIAISLFMSSLIVEAEELTPENPEYVEAIRPSAESGVAWAQAMLGGFYYMGKHVEQDFAEARKWFQLAADQGAPKAMFALGGMYEFGHGVEKDIEKAFTFYQMAAERNHPSAQRKLGAMYHQGKGTSKNNIKAYLWLRLGYVERDKFMSEVFNETKEEMATSEIIEAERLLKEYSEKSSLTR